MVCTLGASCWLPGYYRTWCGSMGYRYTYLRTVHGRLSRMSFLSGLLVGLLICSLINTLLYFHYLCLVDNRCWADDLKRMKDGRGTARSRVTLYPGNGAGPSNSSILCWIATSPERFESAALRVNTTWAKRCDKFIIFSSADDSTLPVVYLNVSEGEEHLTAKTMLACSYLYKHHINEYDWFLKADDDTYIVVENLRHFLETKSPNEPHYFGHLLQNQDGLQYMSGGAGYVLSRTALKMLFEDGINTSRCQSDGGSEDEVLGECLRSVGVKGQRSLDRNRKSLFHCFTDADHIEGLFPLWYYKMDVIGHGNTTLANMSDSSISFHSIGVTELYSLEYQTYHLKPFGITW